jgi:ATP-dependent Clp protease ATP-binding subunit ClpA
MFDRFTEKARRSIFFARYEASTYGSGYIETEHLLLGLLREDRALFMQLGIGSTEAFRQKVDARLQPANITSLSNVGWLRCPDQAAAIAARSGPCA